MNWDFLIESKSRPTRSHAPRSSSSRSRYRSGDGNPPMFTPSAYLGRQPQDAPT